MAFSPAWGGTIPLVPIGSFRGFLGKRQRGKALRVWFTGTITRAVVTSALKTAVGKRAAANMNGVIRAMGFKASPSTIATELEAYIAFQKFEHRQAVQRKNEASQRRIEAVMFAPGGRIVVSGRKPTGQLIPAEYFKMMADRTRQPPPGRVGGPPLKPEDIESPQIAAFAIWFERRKRRRGRFSNV